MEGWANAGNVGLGSSTMLGRGTESENADLLVREALLELSTGISAGEFSMAFRDTYNRRHTQYLEGDLLLTA